MNNTLKIPFYAKTALIFICLFAFIYTLIIAKDILVPLVFGTIFAILLNPFVNYLHGKKINRVLAISIVIALATIVTISITYLIFVQLSMFSETVPQLKERFTEAGTELNKWVAYNFNIKPAKINEWMLNYQNDAVDNFSIGEKFTSIGKILITVMLLPVYVFLILLYKSLLLEFISKVFRNDQHFAITEILIKTKKIIQTYLVGLFFEMLIVATLNSIGLLLIGIEYAIILGVIGAILNIIPYIGGIIAISLPMIIAFVTKDSITYPILVFFVYLFIQFVDNNFIVPKIVASRVKINALISIIVVLIGGAIWGVPGMFLSIPLTAIIKVICDHVEPLKPWGFLLGDIVPTTSNFSFKKVFY